MLSQFSKVVGDTDKSKIDWPSFIEHLALLREAGTLQATNAADVYSLVCRDAFYEQAYNEIRILCQIALTIPLSTAWPERGFSRLSNIKCKARNRLGDKMVQALMSIFINGPSRLTDDMALAIADRWYNHKHRRNIGAQGEKNQMEDGDTRMSKLELLDDKVDLEQFWL